MIQRAGSRTSDHAGDGSLDHEVTGVSAAWGWWWRSRGTGEVGDAVDGGPARPFGVPSTIRGEDAGRGEIVERLDQQRRGFSVSLRLPGG